MLKQLDANSRHAILPEVDLKVIPPSQMGVENVRWTKVSLKNTLIAGSTGPFEFQLCSNSRSYINLKRSWIVWTFNITDNAGDAVPLTNIADNPTISYAPCQGIAGAFGKQYLLHINGTLVDSSSVNCAYRYYVENELMLTNEAKSSTLSHAGYYPDILMEHQASVGYLARAELVKNGRQCQVACRIPIDLAGQDKVLLNYMDVRLTVFTNESPFLIDEFEAATTRKLKVNIKDVHVLLCEYTLSDGLMTAYERALMEERITYSLNSVQLRSMYIPAGSMHSPNFQVFNTHCPKRITIGLLSADSYNGSYTKSAFNFQHFDLKNLFVDVGGVTYPSRPWNLSFDPDQPAYLAGYLSTIDALGFSRSTESNGITLDQFGKGWGLYSVEITPAVHSGMVDLIKNLTVVVRLEFSKQVPVGGIYCLVFLEVDQTLAIDGQRQVYVDSLV